MELSKHVRNILLKCFLFTVLFMIIGHVIYYFNTDAITDLCQVLFKVTPEQARLVIFQSYVTIKMIAVFFFLIPAIAIQLEYLRCFCYMRKEKN